MVNIFLKRVLLYSPVLTGVGFLSYNAFQFYVTTPSYSKILLKYFRETHIEQFLNEKEKTIIKVDVPLRHVHDAFKYRNGGVSVLSAPPGSGKTTMVAREALKHRAVGNRVDVLTRVRSKDELFRYLGIPPDSRFQLS
jgi:hypothetical protein